MAKTPVKIGLVGKLIECAEAWLDTAEHVMTLSAEDFRTVLDCLDEAVHALAQAKQWGNNEEGVREIANLLQRLLEIRATAEDWARAWR